jgi:phosphopantetheine--protein transferase-like protein
MTPDLRPASGVLGVGTDILSVKRMRDCLDAPAFLRKTFTELELDLGTSRADPGSYYAKVFAGKEAVFKCFGLQADSLSSWTDIEIVDGGERQPVVRLHGEMAGFAANRGVREVLLSLSYDTDYAIAFAAVVGEAGHDD